MAAAPIAGVLGELATKLDRHLTFINRAPVVVIHRIGVEGPLTFWGGLPSLDAFGHICVKATTATEPRVAAPRDFQQVRGSRDLVPTVRSLKPAKPGRRPRQTGHGTKGWTVARHKSRR